MPIDSMGYINYWMYIQCVYVLLCYRKVLLCYRWSVTGNSVDMGCAVCVLWAAY